MDSQTQLIVTVVVAVIGSSALFQFIQFMIQRKDNKEEKSLNSQLDELKQSILSNIDDIVVDITAKYEKRWDETNAKYQQTQERIDEMLVIYQEDRKQMLEQTAELRREQETMRADINLLISRQKNVTDVMTGLSQDRIVEKADRVIKRGAITPREKSILENICVPYRAGGGNSHAKSSCEEIATLPLISEEIAEAMDTARREDEFTKMLDTYLSRHSDAKSRLELVKEKYGFK